MGACVVSSGLKKDKYSLTLKTAANNVCAKASCTSTTGTPTEADQSACCVVNTRTCSTYSTISTWSSGTAASTICGTISQTTIVDGPENIYLPQAAQSYTIADTDNPAKADFETTLDDTKKKVIANRCCVGGDNVLVAS